MAQYVDGFVIPIPNGKIDDYKRMAQKASKIWMEHGALEYRECVAEDVDTKFGLSFPAGIKTKPDETVVFAWIVYKSRAHRDRVNANVMKDPRIAEDMEKMEMPFDCKRMIYGGFKVLVEALATSDKTQS